VVVRVARPRGGLARRRGLWQMTQRRRAEERSPPIQSTHPLYRGVLTASVARNPDMEEAR